MEQLTIVGSEDGMLVVVTESGARYGLPINDVLRTELRKARAGSDAPEAPRARPRDIQTHIRAGLSAAEVAELLGTTLADVARYEGPVLAERQHMVDQALAIPVLIGTELEPDGSLSFGAAIRAKLAELEATGERWTSWKDEDGWSIKVEFTANEVEHDARWGFEPRRSTLTPQNSTATQLSRKGALPEGLIPRLRALDTHTPSPFKDESRFDSGAFGPRRIRPEAAAAPSESETPDAEVDDLPRTTTSDRGGVVDAAVKRAPEPTEPTHPDTADLLEALRRRRGQREPAPGFDDDAPVTTPAPGPQRPDEQTSRPPLALFPDAAATTDESDADDDEIVAEKEAAEREQQTRKRGRTSMPSWDEIVFGARTDD